MSQSQAYMSPYNEPYMFDYNNINDEIPQRSVEYFKRRAQFLRLGKRNARKTKYLQLDKK